MNKILNYDQGASILTVQPGALAQEVIDFLSDKDKFYPPNPTETLSSIGGNIATNASGSRTYKYGPTRKYVQRLKILLPQGDILDLKRGEIFADKNYFEFTSDSRNYSFSFESLPMPNVKNASGLYLKENMDLIDLFIGCEGLLGITMEADLRVIKRPLKTISLIIFFYNKTNLLNALTAVKQRFKSISLIEYFDKSSLNYIRMSTSEIPAKASYALWIEDEVEEDREDSFLEEWMAFIQEYSSLGYYTWFAQSSSELKRISDFRHSLPLKVNEELIRNKQSKIGTDSAVPDDAFEDYYNFITEELDSLGYKHFIYGHIGNSHLHADIMISNQKERDKALEIYDVLMLKAIELNGTVSAEHGIGKVKKKHLMMMYGPSGINAMKQVKLKLDPDNLLNRGNMFDI
jgi:D-lactate dehydrogenase (cytochrome)